MVRITTNGMLFNYRNNLTNTTNSLNNAITKVMTQRNFNTYASDPAAATRAFRVHSSLNAVNAQYSNNKTVLSKFETAWSTIGGVLNDLANKLGSVPALEGLDGTKWDDLDTQGQILRSGAEAMVQSMNGKYDQKYIFSGSDSKEPPFAIDEAGDITYRGVKVDKNLDEEYKDADGNPMLDEAGQPMTNAQVLKKWAEDDPVFVDIGLGFELDANGKVIESTAFDSSISGIDIMGYGVDEDGDPKNLASIMLRLADIFESYDAEKSDPWDGQYEEACRLVNKFNQSREDMIDAYAELDAQALFLNKNETQLENTFDALNTERGSIEDVDPADAILELSWAQVCYNSALQVGANVIPQSLMDYLQ